MSGMSWVPASPTPSSASSMSDPASAAMESLGCSASSSPPSISPSPAWWGPSPGHGATPPRVVYPVVAQAYMLVEEIGQGATSTVFSAKCLPLDQMVAIKIIDLECSHCSLDEIRKEAQMMRTLWHPNLVRAHCLFPRGQDLWVVMPLCKGGSALNLLQKLCPLGLEEPAIATILRDTLKALDYLHRHGLIHRDVKARNILLDGRGGVKLADFGASAALFDRGDRKHCCKSVAGTPCWMAPEIFKQQGYDFKADIWSFGITALELALGRHPYARLPPLKALTLTLQGPTPGLDVINEKKFSKAYKEMVQLCLCKDPAQRPSADKLLKHPFFKQARSADFLVDNYLRRLAALGERALSHTGRECVMGLSAWTLNLDNMKKYLPGSPTKGMRRTSSDTSGLPGLLSALNMSWRISRGMFKPSVCPRPASSETLCHPTSPSTSAAAIPESPSLALAGVERRRFRSRVRSRLLRMNLAGCVDLSQVHEESQRGGGEESHEHGAEGHNVRWATSPKADPAVLGTE